jgi:hypothetical protein
MKVRWDRSSVRSPLRGMACSKAAVTSPGPGRDRSRAHPAEPQGRSGYGGRPL